MIRKHSKAIVRMLVLFVVSSSSAILAAVPTDDKPKIDMGYVTPDTIVSVVFHPRNMLNSPKMKKIPPEAAKSIKDMSKMFWARKWSRPRPFRRQVKCFWESTRSRLNKC